nr:uncharacterized protein LOC127315983 [Lolium perenne]
MRRKAEMNLDTAATALPSPRPAPSRPGPDAAPPLPPPLPTAARPRPAPAYRVRALARSPAPRPRRLAPAHGRAHPPAAARQGRAAHSPGHAPRAAPPSQPSTPPPHPPGRSLASPAPRSAHLVPQPPGRPAGRPRASQAKRAHQPTAMPVVLCRISIWRDWERAGARFGVIGCVQQLDLARFGESSCDFVKVQRATSGGLTLYSASHPVLVRGEEPPRNRKQQKSVRGPVLRGLLDGRVEPKPV